MRRREISPDFWSDERIWRLSDAARLLLPGLWQLADREGRMLDKPFEIGVKVRPWAPTEVAGLLEELIAAGLVLRYAADGVMCLALPPAAWARHQRVHPKEMVSKLPGVPRDFIPAVKLHGQPGKDRKVKKISPGSSGPSGPSGPSGSSGSSGPYGAGEKFELSQPELPAIPPAPPPPKREPSEQEKLYRMFQELRALVFEENGLEFVPDRVSGPAFVNTALRPMLVAVAREASDCGQHPDERVRAMMGTPSGYIEARLFVEFFKDRWAAGLEPPWPFNAFVAEKVWRKYLPVDDETREVH